MSLFHFGKKEKTPSCCCSAPVKSGPACDCNSGAPTREADACCRGDGKCTIRSMKVLGAGCKSCHEQYENCRAAVEELGVKVEVEYITDMEKIMDYGVMSMPGIVVNEKVIAMGRVLKEADVIRLLEKSGYC